ncbi:MAG: hypothetical protein ISR65_18165 [Bacteriovoracaceae bacterium]|nr:hypothetical protein [Bacteriovoracaceae bacterium]
MKNTFKALIILLISITFSNQIYAKSISLQAPAVNGTTTSESYEIQDIQLSYVVSASWYNVNIFGSGSSDGADFYNKQISTRSGDEFSFKTKLTYAPFRCTFKSCTYNVRIHAAFKVEGDHQLYCFISPCGSISNGSDFKADLNKCKQKLQNGINITLNYTKKESPDGNVNLTQYRGVCKLD